MQTWEGNPKFFSQAGKRVGVRMHSVCLPCFCILFGPSRLSCTMGFHPHVFQWTLVSSFHCQMFVQCPKFSNSNPKCSVSLYSPIPGHGFDSRCVHFLFFLVYFFCSVSFYWSLVFCFIFHLSISSYLGRLFTFILLC